MTLYFDFAWRSKIKVDCTVEIAFYLTFSHASKLKLLIMTSKLENRLSNITTNWEELIAAHDDDQFDQVGARLRGEILRRYADCVFQYILGATKNHHAAEDLTQEFALRFVRGDFRNANPRQGRFRDYLKTSLRNLVTDFFRSKANNESIEKLGDDLARSIALESLESTFAEQWRQRVLGITWNALQEFESAKQTQYYSVLFIRTQHPDSSSDDLAELFSEQKGRAVSAAWIRQTLHRARTKFAELLIDEVGKTLNSSSRQEIRDELADLGLKKYIDLN